MPDLEILKFDIFKPYEDMLVHGVTTRNGGVSPAPFDTLNLAFDSGDQKNNVVANYKIICDALGIEMEKIIHPSPQCHTDKVMLVDENCGYTFHSPPSLLDGFITKTSGIPILVRFADCQGVLMLDPVQKVIAVVHCGWKGNTKNILGKCVRKMVDEIDCNAADILVGISPSLGPESAEFSDPMNELPGFMHQFVNGNKVDLWACSLLQLMSEGILETNVENMHRDTMQETDKFFSYRASGGAEGQTGRMAGLIMLK